jgi:hypothetical protein
VRIPQPGDQFGRYRIDRIVGQGGMGVVYAATDTRLDRTVALKVITGPLAGNEEFLRRFHDEASTLSRLDSPYVVQITDHDEIDGIPYIVTQYVDGTDLASYLTEHGAMPARSALTLAAQVARGLGDAHRRGVIHRDIKPGNVLVRNIGTPDMHAYVCDFGIARSENSGELTSTGMVAGTWGYLAPERTQGGSASPASDLYALGCLLWACLSGRPPYEGTDVEVALAHSQAPLPQLPGGDAFTTELNKVLSLLLAKDPAQRHPDAGAARDDLQRLAMSAPAAVVTTASGPSGPTAVRPADPTAPRSPAAPSAPKRRWPIAVAAAVVLLLAGGGAVAAVALGGDDDKDGDDTDEAAHEAPVSGDVDGDGYGDLLLNQTRSGTFTPLALWTLPSFGGGFGTPERAATQEGYASAGDIDGDGKLDVLWATDDAAQLTVHVLPGAGDPWEQTVTLADGVNIADYDVAPVDLTGDGKADLVIPGQTDHDDVYVAVSTGDGFEEPQQWWASDQSYGYWWDGDFDGDGTGELLYWADSDAAQAGEVRLLGADGERLTELANRPLKGASLNPNLSPWMVGDPDGDGQDELVAFTAKGRRIVVSELTDGALTDPATWWFTKLTDEEAAEQVHDTSVLTYTLSDVDGDGDDDAVEVLRAVDDEIRVTVRISDGSAFADPVDWGSLSCDGDECEDTLWAVD